MYNKCVEKVASPVTALHSSVQFLKMTIGLGLGFLCVCLGLAFCAFFCFSSACVVCFYCIRFCFFSTTRDWI